MANKSILYRKDVKPSRREESIADTLVVFEEKSQVADSLISSLRSSLRSGFQNILRQGVSNLISEGGLTGEDMQRIASNTPINIGAEFGGGYGLGLGLNVPSSEANPRGKQDFQIKLTKSFQEGGEVGDEVSIYNQLLEQVAGKAKMETGEVENLMSKIAYRESKSVPTQKQISKHPKVSEEGWESLYPEEEGKAYSGPGRGLYQYELDSLGGSGAGRTAMNRLYAVLGGDLKKDKKPENLPEWASAYFGKEGSKRDVDFSELTEGQQNILFLADKLQDPMKGNIASMKTMDPAEWWKKFHHKGKVSKKEEKELIKSFAEDISFAESKGATWNQ